MNKQEYEALWVEMTEAAKHGDKTDKAFGIALDLSRQLGDALNVLEQLYDDLCGRCECTDAYTGRGLIAPNCPANDFGYEVAEFLGREKPCRGWRERHRRFVEAMEANGWPAS